MTNILTVESFSKEIMRLVQEGGLSFMDAIIHYQEQSGVEAETVALLIDPYIKEKLELEAYELNFFGRKTPKLVFGEEDDIKEE